VGALSWGERRLGLAIVGGDLVGDGWASRGGLCVGARHWNAEIWAWDAGRRINSTSARGTWRTTQKAAIPAISEDRRRASRCGLLDGSVLTVWNQESTAENNSSNDQT
jgi:hypothetical protein